MKFLQELDTADNIKIGSVEVHDSYAGEVFGSKFLTVDGVKKSGVDVNIVDDEVNIRNIVTADDSKGKGLAQQLVNDLFREFPDKKITVTDMTGPGEQFFTKNYIVDKDTREIKLKPASTLDEQINGAPSEIDTAPLSFIRELAEARMTRSASRTEKLSYNDTCERAYLCLLILDLLRQFSRFRERASSYAQDTVKYSGFDNFRMSATDLYNFLYFVTGDKQAMQRLRDPARAQEMRNLTTLPALQVLRYLRKVVRGAQPEQVSQLFMRLEKELRITQPQYKSIRRVITNLPKSSKQNIESAVTKLLFAARAKLRSSDLINDLEALARARDLESPLVPDDEVIATKPDMVVKDSDLIYLQRLVGTKNLFLAMKYIEMSSQGKTIPSHLVQAFNPALEVLVDIIKGGPAFISGLKRIQKSAKQARRRQ